MTYLLRSIALGIALGIMPIVSLAQTGASVAFGSLKGDPSQPVEVTSDRLQVNQSDGSALFSGDVLVVQGGMRLSAAEVQVEYGADGQRIERLLATGGVTLANGGEAAEADAATYTIDTGTVVMTGDVLLTQGGSALSGGQLTVDLTTGTGVMEGRVKTVFVPADSP